MTEVAYCLLKCNWKINPYWASQPRYFKLKSQELWTFTLRIRWIPLSTCIIFNLIMCLLLVIVFSLYTKSLLFRKFWFAILVVNYFTTPPQKYFTCPYTQRNFLIYILSPPFFYCMWPRKNNVNKMTYKDRRKVIPSVLVFDVQVRLLHGNFCSIILFPYSLVQMVAQWRFQKILNLWTLKVKAKVSI